VSDANLFSGPHACAPASYPFRPDTTERGLAWRGRCLLDAVLKNMAVHELALAVTYYGVTAENISSVDGDKEFSICETRNVRIQLSLSPCSVRAPTQIAEA
jgi:hypothetical protein